MRTGCFNGGQERPQVARLDLICLLMLGPTLDRNRDGKSDEAPQPLVQQRFNQTEFLQQLSYAGKANTATTAFARSRLPRSLLIAHSADVAAGFV